jgi:hypothetical protein
VSEEAAEDVAAELGRLCEEVAALAVSLAALLEEARRTNELLRQILDALAG